MEGEFLALTLKISNNNMAKISPVSIKYMIYAKFEAEGMLEKPDVIGALFGQTEGLLGSDLEMRELQKEGKIGRIEVELSSEKSKTTGTINIPSALDKTETTLVAAAIETIERVGPSNAKITIEKIEDVRENKRDYILERAKKLLEGIDEKMPKSKEITETIKSESRTSRIKEYGDEKLPCGSIEGNELIIVEGRADVINLLRNGVDNVIGMNGTLLPEEIKKLSFEKEVTLFVDGDRGGKLIAKNVIDNARVDFIAFAPDGKEVEELSGKEILVSLRRKIPLSEYLKYSKTPGYGAARKERGPEEEKEQLSNLPLADLSESRDKLSSHMKEVEGTKSVILLDNQLESISKSNSRNLFLILKKYKPYVLIIDTVNRSVIEAAEDSGVKNIAAKTFTFTNTSINLISL